VASNLRSDQLTLVGIETPLVVAKSVAWKRTWTANALMPPLSSYSSMPLEVENLSDMVTGMDPVSLKFDTHPRLDWKGHASSHFDDKHSNLRALHVYCVSTTRESGLFKRHRTLDNMCMLFR
jgi:hypothetical protein